MLSCNGYLDHPFKNMHFENDNEPSSTACKQRKVSVKSGVVDLILMLEQRQSHVMEKLILWFVFLHISCG
jgi:hypothetical protein